MTGITRRLFVVSMAAFVTAPFFAQTTSARILGKTLSVEEAYELALTKEITLVDIRRPDEWAATGVGVGAVPLDMRRGDFLEKLDAVLNGDRSKPVAVMCARGVRSKWLSKQLESAGFTQIIDVPEGMLGSKSGPGWIRIGLPVVR